MVLWNKSGTHDSSLQTADGKTFISQFEKGYWKIFKFNKIKMHKIYDDFLTCRYPEHKNDIMNVIISREDFTIIDSYVLSLFPKNAFYE